MTVQKRPWAFLRSTGMRDSPDSEDLKAVYTNTAARSSEKTFICRVYGEKELSDEN